MNTKAPLDDGLEVGELTTVVSLFVAYGEGQVGGIQLSAELLEDRGVAEEMVDDSFLDGGCGVGAGGDLVMDELVILFLLLFITKERGLHWSGYT